MTGSCQLQNILKEKKQVEVKKKKKKKSFLF